MCPNSKRWKGILDQGFGLKHIKVLGIWHSLKMRSMFKVTVSGAIAQCFSCGAETTHQGRHSTCLPNQSRHGNLLQSAVAQSAVHHHDKDSLPMLAQLDGSLHVTACPRNAPAARIDPCVFIQGSSGPVILNYGCSSSAEIANSLSRPCGAFAAA